MQPDTNVAYLYRIAVSDVGFTSDVCTYNTTKQEQTEEYVDVFHTAILNPNNSAVDIRYQHVIPPAYHFEGTQYAG